MHGFLFDGTVGLHEDKSRPPECLATGEILLPHYMACTVNFLCQHASLSRSISGVLCTIPLKQGPKVSPFVFLQNDMQCEHVFLTQYHAFERHLQSPFSRLYRILSKNPSLQIFVTC